MSLMGMDKNAPASGVGTGLHASLMTDDIQSTVTNLNIYYWSFTYNVGKINQRLMAFKCGKCYLMIISMDVLIIGGIILCGLPSNFSPLSKAYIKEYNIVNASLKLKPWKETFFAVI